MVDLFPHGTVVFVDIKKGIRFCTQVTPPELWSYTLNSQHNFYISDYIICLPPDSALVYLGPDKSQQPAYITTAPWDNKAQTLYYPHAFLYRGKLLIKPIMWDKENHRLLNAVRGLFYAADD